MQALLSLVHVAVHVCASHTRTHPCAFLRVHAQPCVSCASMRIMRVLVCHAIAHACAHHQVPKSDYDAFHHIAYAPRRVYAAMVRHVGRPTQCPFPPSSLSPPPPTALSTPPSPPPHPLIVTVHCAPVAQVAHMDMLIGRMVALLTKKQMLASTLLVFSADNGGPITQAANNWPLRGSKHSNWDGGVRVNAWLSGGVVPTDRRGTLTSSLVTLWDW